MQKDWNKWWICLAELKRLPLREPQASITNVVEQWEEFTSTGFQEPIQLLKYSLKSKLSSFEFAVSLSTSISVGKLCK